MLNMTTALMPSNLIDLPELSELKGMQANFVMEYVKDFNGTQAAKRAGYAKSSAGSTAVIMLKHPGIRVAVQAARRYMALKLELSVDRILQEYQKIAYSDIKNYLKFDEKGVKVFNSSDVDTVAVAEVQQVETEHGRQIKLKLYDKRAALDALAEYVGIKGMGYQPPNVSLQIINKSDGDNGKGTSVKIRFDPGGEIPPQRIPTKTIPEKSNGD